MRKEEERAVHAVQKNDEKETTTRTRAAATHNAGRRRASRRQKGPRVVGWFRGRVAGAGAYSKNTRADASDRYKGRGLTGAEEGGHGARV